MLPRPQHPAPPPNEATAQADAAVAVDADVPSSDVAGFMSASLGEHDAVERALRASEEKQAAPEPPSAAQARDSPHRSEGSPRRDSAGPACLSGSTLNDPPPRGARAASARRDKAGERPVWLAAPPPRATPVVAGPRCANSGRAMFSAAEVRGLVGPLGSVDLLMGVIGLSTGRFAVGIGRELVT